DRGLRPVLRAAVAVAMTAELTLLVGDEQGRGARVVANLDYGHLHVPRSVLSDGGQRGLRHVRPALHLPEGARSGIDQTGVPVAPSDRVRRAAVAALDLHHLPVAHGVVDPSGSENDAVPNLRLHDVLRYLVAGSVPPACSCAT